jgi:hypothetical protein
MLTEEHKEARKAICTELLQRYENKGDAFMSRTVTGDETWVHNYEPQKKRKPMKWHHRASSCKKKFGTLLWVRYDITLLLVDFCEKGATVTSTSSGN